MVSETFGFNLEANVGYWSGPTLNKIDNGIRNSEAFQESLVAQA